MSWEIPRSWQPITDEERAAIWDKPVKVDEPIEEEEEMTPAILCKIADDVIHDCQVTDAVIAIKQAISMKASLGSRALRIRIDLDYCYFEERITKSGDPPSLHHCLPEVLVKYVVPEFKEMGFICYQTSDDVYITWCSDASLQDAPAS